MWLQHLELDPVVLVGKHRCEEMDWGVGGKCQTRTSPSPLFDGTCSIPGRVHFSWFGLQQDNRILVETE